MGRRRLNCGSLGCRRPHLAKGEPFESPFRARSRPAMSEPAVRRRRTVGESNGAEGMIRRIPPVDENYQRARFCWLFWFSKEAGNRRVPPVTIGFVSYLLATFRRVKRALPTIVSLQDNTQPYLARPADRSRGGPPRPSPEIDFSGRLTLAKRSLSYGFHPRSPPPPSPESSSGLTSSFFASVLFQSASAGVCAGERPAESVGKLFGRGTMQRTMPPHGVVVDAPGFD